MPKPQIRPAYRPLPKLLRELRASAGLTQRDLAKRLRLPQNTIYRLEHGIRRCDAVELIAWCRACQADPREVFERLMTATR